MSFRGEPAAPSQNGSGLERPNGVIASPQMPTIALPGGGANMPAPCGPCTPNMPPPPPIGSNIPGFNTPGQPGGPPSLTQGIPDPGAIARQKDVYLKMLDDQLKQGINVLDQQVKYQRDYLTVQCEQQKKQFLLQLDQQMKAQEMVLTQQYNEQLMALQMQAGTQKAALEQQAMQLSMEYEQRKAEEHMYRQQYEIQQQQTEMAVKMARDYQRMAPPSPMQGPCSEMGPPSYSPPTLNGSSGAGSYVPAPCAQCAGPGYYTGPTSVAPPNMVMNGPPMMYTTGRPPSPMPGQSGAYSPSPYPPTLLVR